MYTQKQWIDFYKINQNIKSDYRLAKIFGVQQCYINQYRKERLKIPLGIILKMAGDLEIEPMEIIAGLALNKTKEPWLATVKSAYFKALTKTIGQRMSLSSSRYYRRR